MPNNRREFVRLTLLAASGLLIPFSSCNSSNKQEQSNESDSAANEKIALENFGIQLWTVKDEMAKNPKEVLRQLASYGYTQIESFEGEKGIFWGMKNTEFRDYVEELGMNMLASHSNVRQDLEAKAAQAAEIGMKYLIDPHEGPQKSLDDFKRMAERFNQYGEICKSHGIRFAYHNHDYSFRELEGEIPHKLLLGNTDPELVDFEMDIYWVVTAGADPEEYLKNYPGRFRLGHVKDRIKNADATETNASTELGAGSLDYAGIIKTAQANGMEYFIAEQERFDERGPLLSSERNAQYLKDLRI